MTSRELLKGLEVDLNRLIDAFAERVQEGAPLSFATFKEIWKEMHMAFILVCAACEDEIGAHIQDIFMCALDRFDLPSPLKHGQSFGDLHRPRLRRPGPLDKRTSLGHLLASSPESDAPDSCPDEEMEGAQERDHLFCDAFKRASSFPMRELQSLISFEDRVAVIYVLYCVYKEQCLEPRVCVHVPIDMLPLFVEFLPKLLEYKVLDALHMIQQLWKENAFVFDVMRRPPSFLCLPLESSPSEASALRELSFHLKTSLQELSRVDKLEKDCDEYTELQQQLICSRLGQRHNAPELMTFNGDVGRWLRNVTAQELQQVHQGITGLGPKEGHAKRKPQPEKQPRPRTRDMDKEKKRKWIESLPKVVLSEDDSWGINAPGLPKMARLVMMRDKAKRKVAEATDHHQSPANAEGSPTTLMRELRSEDFYDAFSDADALRSEQGPQAQSAREQQPASPDLQEGHQDREVTRSEVQTDSRSIQNEKEKGSDSQPCESVDDSQDEAEDSSDDEEIRQYRKELDSLNAEISETSNIVPPSTP